MTGTIHSRYRMLLTVASTVLGAGAIGLGLAVQAQTGSALAGLAAGAAALVWLGAAHCVVALQLANTGLLERIADALDSGAAPQGASARPDRPAANAAAAAPTALRLTPMPPPAPAPQPGRRQEPPLFSRKG